jgi:hypothetical protein
MAPLKIKEQSLITHLFDAEHIIAVLDPVLCGIYPPGKETFVILANAGKT